MTNCTLKNSAPKSTSVLHLPTTVGGQAWALANGERAIGLDAKVLALYGNYLDYPADYAYTLERKGALGRAIGHLSALARFRSGFDAYHFNYGSSIIHFLRRGILHWDLPIFDSSARKIFTYNGCDARQKDITVQMQRKRHGDAAIAACFNPNCYAGLCNSGVVDRNRRKAIEKAARYADHIFALNPDLLQFLPREKATFLPYAVAGFESIALRPTPPGSGEKIRLVHAPTNRVVKGTSYILSALKRLSDRFPGKIEIVVVEGVSHEEALKIFKTADIVVDQVLVGWYGGLAVEVMKMGIPVASYINDDHFEYVPIPMVKENPIIRINPFDIEEKLLHFIHNREAIAELGMASLRFVERWHDPAKLARITEAAYRGLRLPDIAN